MATKGNGALSRAAGAVVYRERSGQLEVLLVHRPRYKDWSLPKGHLDNGESYEEAAVREVEEETGLAGTLGPTIGSVGYEVKGRRKVVRYWLLEAGDGEFVPNSEADQGWWLSPANARRIVSYARDRNVLAHAERLLRHPDDALIHLVRHTHAGSRREWKDDDRRRPLSPRGVSQAEVINRRLVSQPISRIDSSPYSRCVETVGPLAEMLDLPVVLEPALAEGGAPEDTLRYLYTLQGEHAVLCSHGDIIEGLVGHLAAEGVELEDDPAWKKGSVWELHLRRGRVTAGRYLPPPPF